MVEDEEVGHYVEEVAGFVASGDLVGFVFDEELWGRGDVSLEYS